MLKFKITGSIGLKKNSINLREFFDNIDLVI